MNAQAHRILTASAVLSTIVVLAATRTVTRLGTPAPSERSSTSHVSADLPCTPPPDTMIGWWPFDFVQAFDEADIEAFRDMAGVNNVGVPIGDPPPVVATGYVAAGVALNGRDQYVRVADHPEIAFGTGDFTIDAWINLDPLNSTADPQGPRTGRRPIVDKSATGPADAPIGFSFFVQDGRLAFAMSGPLDPLASVVSQAVIGAGWQLAAVTVHRPAGWAGGTGTLYLNGIATDTFVIAPSAESPDNATDLLIGSDNPSFGRQDQNYFWGGIDEVELFRRALTADAIAAIYASGPAGKCKTADGGVPPAPGEKATPMPNPFGVDEIVNVDVANACGATANGFRFVLSDFTPSYDINSTNYPFPKRFEVPCPGPQNQPDCNPFIGPPAVPTYTASTALAPGNIVLGWRKDTPGLANGQTGHFGYTLGTGYGHTVRGQLTTGSPTPTILCEAAAQSSEWSGSADTVTLTVQNLMPRPMEVELRGTAIQRPVTLLDLVPGNTGLMRVLGSPLASSVLATGERRAVTIPIGAADRGVVVLADWFFHDGQRGALQSRAFHARTLREDRLPRYRRFIPWASYWTPPSQVIRSSSDN